jgi:hypothetical protein
LPTDSGSGKLRAALELKRIQLAEVADRLGQRGEVLAVGEVEREQRAEVAD